jgi:hypothetical protein
VLGEVFNFAAARAAIFAALVFAAVKAFFLLFFTEGVHLLFYVLVCGGSLSRFYVFAAVAVDLYECAFSIRGLRLFRLYALSFSLFLAGINFFNVVSRLWHENNQVFKQAFKVGAVINVLMLLCHGRAINRGQFDQKVSSSVECVVHVSTIGINAPSSNRKE